MSPRSLIARMASSAAAVRKVTSATGRPPATRAAPSGPASAAESRTTTGTRRVAPSADRTSIVPTSISLGGILDSDYGIQHGTIASPTQAVRPTSGSDSPAGSSDGRTAVICWCSQVTRSVVIRSTGAVMLTAATADPERNSGTARQLIPGSFSCSSVANPRARLDDRRPDVVDVDGGAARVPDVAGEHRTIRPPVGQQSTAQRSRHRRAAPAHCGPHPHRALRLDLVQVDHVHPTEHPEVHQLHRCTCLLYTSPSPR